MTDLPPNKCLKVLINIQYLNLSHNMIINFDANNFNENSNIKNINLSHNLIENLNDI